VLFAELAVRFPEGHRKHGSVRCLLRPRESAATARVARAVPVVVRVL
jgi:hypothetical protein